jgi:UDP-N-acetylglucosamine 2-epimerase (non-hydrolysing)
VIKELKATSAFSVKVLATAQHREMLDQAFAIFEITPDFDLNLMQAGQGLGSLTAKVISGVTEIFIHEKPDLVIVQGDTTTVFATAIAAFYLGIEVAHVEAGLRTHDILSPFPEEFNRVAVSKVANFHFAPTIDAQRNLLNEGVPKERIWVTGNTGIDSLMGIAALTGFNKKQNISHSINRVLITCHRRENFGEPLSRIVEAICRLASEFENIQFDFPVHPNPAVRELVNRELSKFKNLNLLNPLDYLSMVKAIQESDFVISDSGGIQEEAPALKKPVLVLRESSERMEAVHANVACLVGSDVEKIYESAKKLIIDGEFYNSMANGSSPFGDGKASARIAAVLKKSFEY